MSVTITLTPAGRVNTPPATLNAELIAGATALSPGLTANLPGSLIEDISSTDTGALVIIDQLVTELVDSFSPYSANPYILTELGQIYLGQGSTSASASNTSVYVVFSGTVGFVISPGFVVGDGTNQYAVADGGIIETGGSSNLVFAQALNSGSFAVPAGTVTTLVTSVPSGVTLSVTNPSAGTPGAPAQTQAQYRSQVLQAGLVAGTGTPNFLKTLLLSVPGVEAQFISVRPQAGGLWEVIVGGTGDPYAIALAIFQSGIDINTLTGSTLAVTGITNANPGVVTTNLNHGYSTGQVVTIEGVVGMSGINGTPMTITVITLKTFSIGISTTGSGTWTSGGVVTPNFRNTSVAIDSYPDIYTVPFVLPPLQSVLITVTWNTSSVSFVSSTAVAGLVQGPVAAYVNAIPVGAPINLLELNDTFVNSVVSILPENLITVLVWQVTIDGVITAPGAGTQIISGDPESYFSMAASSVTVIQG